MERGGVVILRIREVHVFCRGPQIHVRARPVDPSMVHEPVLLRRVFYILR
jgi:hypothetical protein